MEIRRAQSDGDLTGYAQVWNAITPSEPITVAETKRRLAQQPWRLYLVAGEAGRIVGSGFAGRSDAAERAFLAVRVLPEWWRRGIGIALYEACRPHAVELGAAMISGRIAEHDSDSLRWAANLGFAEVGRDVELVRELGDETPAAPLDAIEIKELTTADHDAIYAIAVECWPDMATPEPMPAPPYNDWAYEELRGPVVFGAFDGERLVGYAALVTRPARPDVLEHGFTAVEPPRPRDRDCTEADAARLGGRARLPRARHLHAGGEQADAGDQREARLPGAACVDSGASRRVDCRRL